MKKYITDEGQFRFERIICADLVQFISELRLESRSYSIDYGDQSLDIEVDYRPGRKVVFIFNGAVERDRVKYPPAFTLRTIASKSDATCVFISDPTLYLSPSILLSWYAGNYVLPLQKVLTGLIKEITNFFKPQNTLFFGGSGGGFASLFYSHDIENSIAFVWNPQTIIKHYHKRHVEDYCNIAFGCKPEDISSHVIQDLASLYSQKKNKNKVVYMQNITDAHVDKHLIPFLGARGFDLRDEVHSQWLDDSLYLHLTDWSRGHNPPPKKVLQHLFHALTKNEFILSQESIERLLNQSTYK